MNRMPATCFALWVSIAFAIPAQAQSGHAHDNASRCTPEHAAMGHCTMPKEPTTEAAQPSRATGSHCTPEHAAMGHCTLPVPTAPTAPTQPREPIPELTDADRSAAFPHLHVDHAHEHGDGRCWRVRFNRFEAWDADHGTGQAWSGNLWIGGDIHRLRLDTSGERSGGATRSANLQALYSRGISPWWDVVVGAKHAFQPESRTWTTAGVRGLAPYMFEISAMAYAGEGGQLQLKVEAEYEMLLTNKLILQPVVEATASWKDEPEYGIGSGLGKLEAGLRLRYEVTREFAPYIGLSHERALGNTADIARSNGDHLRDTRVVAGVRFWF